MNSLQPTSYLASVLIIASLTLTGCATRTEVAQVRGDAQEALRTADKALLLAQEAHTRSIHTEEMVERSFRHSMRK
jgi:transcription initiation factor TFIIIB Brf1 subunit/transcription initiation factor TFIIB